MQRYCVCGQKVAGKRALCDECLKVYGRKASEWPSWLRFWVNDTIREWKLEKEIDDHEDCFTDIGLDQLV